MSLVKNEANKTDTEKIKVLTQALTKISEQEFVSNSDDLAEYLTSVGVKSRSEFLQLVARNALDYISDDGDIL